MDKLAGEAGGCVELTKRTLNSSVIPTRYFMCYANTVSLHIDSLCISPPLPHYPTQSFAF